MNNIVDNLKGYYKQSSINEGFYLEGKRDIFIVVRGKLKYMVQVYKVGKIVVVFM